MYDTEGKIITFEIAELSLDEKRNMYTAIFEHGDYTYTIYFQLAVHPAFRVNAYRLYAFTRQEKITEVNDGYTVYASKVIASEATAYQIGSIYSVALYKDDQQLNGDNLYLVENNTVYFVQRTKDGDLNKTATYYTITLVEKGLGEAGSDLNVIPTYQSATVHSFEVTTVYDADKKAFVDINESENQIKLVYFENRGYVVTSCEYNDGTYTVKTTSGKEFTISIEGEVVVITEVQ
jgi:hypothetical protein